MKRITHVCECGHPLGVRSSYRTKAGIIYRNYVCAACNGAYSTREPLKEPRPKAANGDAGVVYTSVTLTDTENRIVGLLSAREGLSRSALVRRAIRQYFKTIEPSGAAG